MASTPNAAPAPPTQDDADRRVAGGLQQLDSARAEGLQRASAIQATQAAGAARERDRLAAKYGADHPRVQQADARVQAEAQLSTAVSTHAERAAAPVPRVDDATWVVSGRVLTADGKPAPAVTVSLHRDGEWDRASGYACTDANGAFSLTVPANASGTQPRELVASQGGAVLYRDPRPLTPAPGTVDTRVVVLPAGAGLCPPPDGKGGENPSGPGGGSGSGGSGPGNSSSGDSDPGGSGGTGGKVRRGTGGWSVRGRVTDAEGKPAAGLTVTLYDEDLIFDDRLGQTTTGADGEYRLTYRTRDFRDLVEARPDLYVTVLDAQGNELCTAPATARAEAGREEVIDVQLPKPAAKKK